MKKIIVILLTLFLLLPLTINAKIESKNLKESLKDEEIALDSNFNNYKEDDNQIIIYMFRGQGCSHCEEFLKFLNSIINEYGKYFKLRSYEVWYNEDNSKLAYQTSELLETKFEGVPYIIIGDKAFSGYATQYDNDIKSAIKELYNTKVEDRYDIIEEINNKPVSSNNNDQNTNSTVDDDNQNSPTKVEDNNNDDNLQNDIYKEPDNQGGNSGSSTTSETEKETTNDNNKLNTNKDNKILIIGVISGVIILFIILITVINNKKELQ